MEHTDKLEELMRRSSWQQLTDDERRWVQQHVGGEDAYESMRQTELALQSHYSSADDQPNPAVLSNLHQRLASRRAASGTIPLMKRGVPAYAALAAMLVMGFIGYWLGQAPPERIYVDKLVTRVDTVRLPARRDTVIVERVRTVYRTIAPVLTTNSEPLPVTESKGVNMKEKEELEKLMVSGGF